MTHTIRFTKMHGAGNDYIYINGVHNAVPENIEQFAIFASNRHKGIGADGVVVILPSMVADCRMRMFNADGSEGEMCGNAIRCVAKYAYENILIHRKEFLFIETKAGIKIVRVDTRDGNIRSVSVEMGKPEFQTAKIPMSIDQSEWVAQPIDMPDGSQMRFTAVSMGNPHVVTFLDEDIRTLDLPQLGCFMENNALFPNRVNTEFVNIVSPTEMHMRVWERGSGETLACGTGACACVAAAVKNGLMEQGKDIKVVLTGGTLHINYRTDEIIEMRGEAVEVFNGSIFWEE